MNSTLTNIGNSFDSMKRLNKETLKVFANQGIESPNPTAIEFKKADHPLSKPSTTSNCCGDRGDGILTTAIAKLLHDQIRLQSQQQRLAWVRTA